MSPGQELQRATLSDLLAIPEEDRYHEIVAGQLIRKVSTVSHGHTQIAVAAAVNGADHPDGAGRRRGWHLCTSVEVRLEEHEIYRCDLVGWRRESLPVLPKEIPVDVRPDWVCEVISPTQGRFDRIGKLRGYHRAGVPHYWIVDPEEGTFVGMRYRPEGYVLVTLAERGDRVRAEPFTDLELQVTALFDDPEA